MLLVEENVERDAVHKALLSLLRQDVKGDLLNQVSCSVRAYFIKRGSAFCPKLIFRNCSYEKHLITQVTGGFLHNDCMYF